MAAVAAKLYAEGRLSERYALQMDGTLRDSAQQPLDVVVEDLSITGFRVVTAHALEMGMPISLGINGVRGLSARIVRRAAQGWGCEFDTPLTAANLAALTRPECAGALAFPATAMPAPTPDVVVQKFPGAVRFAILTAGVVSSWGLVYAVAVAFG